MNICLFELDEIEKPLDLRDERAEHIIKILHKKVNDTFAAGIVGGPSGRAVITAIDVHDEKSSDGRKTFTGGSISFRFEPDGDGKPLHPLVMIIGFPRPIQLKRLLRDMAGLGVSEIHLTVTDLGEKSYLKSGMATGGEGRRMLIEGCEQAASTHVPELFMHSSLEECFESVAPLLQEGRNGNGLYALDNVNPSGSLPCFSRENPPAEGAVSVAAIGAERGWTDRERKLLEQRGFVRLSMGNRVLRTETASTVAASLILGGMGALD